MTSGARQVLLLGGTTEATELARRLATADLAAQIVVSFAGRTERRAAVPVGAAVRVGGFGGADGLRRYLVANGVELVVDATHPFAARMPFHAAAACSSAGVARLRVLRAAWTPGAGDRWISVADTRAAAAAVDAVGARRVLLTIGRQELAPFAACRSARFVVRSIERPAPGLLDAADVVLARGPFTLDGERDLLHTRRIELIVSKNSGGTATSAKLAAARQLGLPIVMIERPSCPAGPVVGTADEAAAWIAARLGTALGARP